MSVWSVSAQTLTNSPKSNDSDDIKVVTIRGKEYIQLSIKTFGDLERIAEEAKLSRSLIEQLKEIIAQNTKIQAKDGEIIAFKTAESESLRKALVEAEKANLALRDAMGTLEKQVSLLEEKNKALQESLSKARKSNLFWKVVGGVLTVLILK